MSKTLIHVWSSVGDPDPDPGFGIRDPAIFRGIQIRLGSGEFPRDPVSDPGS